MRICLLESTNSRLDREKCDSCLQKKLGIIAELLGATAITAIDVKPLGNSIQQGIPFAHLDMLIIPTAATAD